MCPKLNTYLILIQFFNMGYYAMLKIGPKLSLYVPNKILQFGSLCNNTEKMPNYILFHVFFMLLLHTIRLMVKPYVMIRVIKCLSSSCRYLSKTYTHKQISNLSITSIFENRFLRPIFWSEWDENG